MARDRGQETVGTSSLRPPHPAMQHPRATRGRSGESIDLLLRQKELQIRLILQYRDHDYWKPIQQHGITGEGRQARHDVRLLPYPQLGQERLVRRRDKRLVRQPISPVDRKALKVLIEARMSLRTERGGTLTRSVCIREECHEIIHNSSRPPEPRMKGSADLRQMRAYNDPLSILQGLRPLLRLQIPRPKDRIRPKIHHFHEIKNDLMEV